MVTGEYKYTSHHNTHPPTSPANIAVITILVQHLHYKVLLLRGAVDHRVVSKQKPSMAQKKKKVPTTTQSKNI